MPEPAIKCPICPPDIACEHDADERRELWRLRGEEPELEPVLESVSDRRQVEGKKARDRRRRAARDADLRWLMDQAAGRRFVYALLERCGIYRAIFNPQAPDALRLAHAEGQRNIGLLVLSDVERIAAPAYLLMLNERVADAA